MILLHGNPGTGKTSLCRALAQKLAIRLQNRFPSATLLELNTQVLFSKYFGESVSLVNQAFHRVLELAHDPKTLVCLLIDEIESIAGSRERAIQSNEVGDVVRVTNALLVMLDRMRHVPNVLMLCTSNLVTSIDPAFLDRADLVENVPMPSQAAAYEILRSCFCELIRCKIIESSPVHGTNYLESPEDGIFMNLSELRLSDGLQTENPSKRLWDLSVKCALFSGRKLRRLPFMGLALNTYGRSWTMQGALDSLEKAIDRMKDQKTHGELG
jgi:SpoVK/Ycf46/Vps4 family AAA+-type ATPase